VIDLGILRTWHMHRAAITDEFRNTDNLSYVGISEASVLVETKSGERWRITNPDFMVGLKIEKEVES